ncbi:MAG: glycine cleavage system protein R [Verrucomicrobiae bacterium]|nr:glycine cleavage system protein R [Verrucomicrobiae bacterium]NNJ86915.1 glycine cleavage system protein R [Akkermansiaceae bacterium]
MAKSLVLTICAHDRPGIMSRVSKIVSNNNGNWLESRMARLAGQFAGVVRVECEEEIAGELTKCLEGLSEEGILVQIHDEGDLSDYPYTRCLKIDIFGNDRPGIVSQLTQSISHAGANIEELNSSIKSAAMSGHPIFHASGVVCLPDSIDEESLIAVVEDLSDDLNIEISAV